MLSLRKLYSFLGLLFLLCWRLHDAGKRLRGPGPESPRDVAIHSHECPAMMLPCSVVVSRAVCLHACLVLSCTLAAVPDLKFILIPSFPLPFTSSWTTGALTVGQIFFWGLWRAQSLPEQQPLSHRPRMVSITFLRSSKTTICLHFHTLSY